MWAYTDKVKDYFFNPKNAGVLEQANAVGEVGALSCGDALKLMLNIDPVTEIVLEAKFQTFGCGSAIASSSALTELVIGKTIEEALSITSEDIAEFLGGLPPEKKHCSVLGYEAVQAAIANFRGEAWTNDHEESDLVCKCKGIDASVIERAIRMNRLTSVEQVTAFTKAGEGCLTCYDKLEEILVRVNAELVAERVSADQGAYRGGAERNDRKPASAPKSAVVATSPAAAPRSVNLFAAAARSASAPSPSAGPRPASAPVGVSPIAPASPLPPSSAGLTNLKKIRLIEETIEDLRVYLRKDGGDCELIDVDGSNVLVSLTGACVGCQMASVTVSGIQERLIAKLGIPVRVIPVGRNGH